MIKGKLVGLRAIEKEDLKILRDWRNVPDFRKNFREYRELSMAHQERWHQKTVVESSTDFMFMVERLSDKQPLGAAGLVYVNWLNRAADVSFYIGHENAYIDQQGYAKEAAQLLFDYGFKVLNLHKLWMELYEFDSRKIQFFTEDFKFKKDGVLRDNCFEDGKYWNSFILSILDSEYLKGR